MTAIAPAEAVGAPAGAGASATPSTTEAARASLSAGKTQTLDYDAFLQLLVTQMQNQDPLEPISDTEYIAQLATFSNVEQNILLNDKLQALLTASQLGDAEGLIGRTLEAASGESGTVTKVQITSEGFTAILADGTAVPLGEGVTIS